MRSAPAFNRQQAGLSDDPTDFVEHPAGRAIISMVSRRVAGDFIDFLPSIGKIVRGLGVGRWMLAVPPPSRRSGRRPRQSPHDVVPSASLRLRPVGCHPAAANTPKRMKSSSLGLMRGR
jgi:hypothetical protein